MKCHIQTATINDLKFREVVVYQDSHLQGFDGNYHVKYGRLELG